LWLLCQQEGKLYVSGSSSEVTDPDWIDSKKYPLYHQAQHVDFTLRPGQALYIPALWLHSVLSEDFSISANVFWRDLPMEAYPKKDLYGNRDPVMAEKALARIGEAAVELQKVPGHFRDFYARRCIRQLEAVLGS
jgi:tRNA wybutosine-synthesizing protein 5